MSKPNRIFLYVCVMLNMHKGASSNTVRHLIVFEEKYLGVGRTGYFDKKLAYKIT